MIPITGFEDVFVQPPPPPQSSTSDILRTGGTASEDLWRSYHPVPENVPPVKPFSGGVGKAAPTQSWWEWASSPFLSLGSAIGNLATAPVRAAKSLGLWFGGAIVVVGVLAILLLVVATRFAKTVEG